MCRATHGGVAAPGAVALWAAVVAAAHHYGTMV